VGDADQHYEPVRCCCTSSAQTGKRYEEDVRDLDERKLREKLNAEIKACYIYEGVKYGENGVKYSGYEEEERALWV